MARHHTNMYVYLILKGVHLLLHWQAPPQNIPAALQGQHLSTGTCFCTNKSQSQFLNQNPDMPQTLVKSTILFHSKVLNYLKIAQKIENAARGGVSRDKNSPKGKLSAVFILRNVPESCIFRTNEQRQCFRWYIVL